jgi:hypothetical protein
MSIRFITAFWLLLAALGALGGDSRADGEAIADRLVGFATEAAITAHAHSALHSGDASTSDFAQRRRDTAHARTHPGFSKRFVAVEADRDFLGRALDFQSDHPIAATPRLALATNQARAPPV